MRTEDKTELDHAKELGFETLAEYHSWLSDRAKFFRGKQLYEQEQFDRSCIKFFLDNQVNSDVYSYQSRKPLDD